MGVKTSRRQRRRQLPPTSTLEDQMPRNLEDQQLTATTQWPFLIRRHHCYHNPNRPPTTSETTGVLLRLRWWPAWTSCSAENAFCLHATAAVVFTWTVSRISPHAWDAPRNTLNARGRTSRKRSFTSAATASPRPRPRARQGRQVMTLLALQCRRRRRVQRLAVPIRRPVPPYRRRSTCRLCAEQTVKSTQ